MGFCLRKSLRIVSSSSYVITSAIVTNLLQRPISNTCLLRGICTDQSIPLQQVDAAKLEDAGSRDDFEFWRWSNGGGSFHKSANVHQTAVIEFGALVHSQAHVGENAFIASGAIVGPGVTIGECTRLGYNVSLTNCNIGDYCIIHNGVCIGQDGFGFFVDEHGNMVKKPQLLKVKVGDQVEIGANTCIDRGSWRDTVIGDHSKIDNLVQIGHNVQIGKKCMICGQVGIAGSVTIGDYVTMGGRVAIRDHVCITSKVRLAANSCVTKDIHESGDYGGFPAMPIAKWRRVLAAQHLSLK